MIVMGKGLVEVLHDLESRVEQLEKARDERNRDYVELAKEYQEVLDQFVEHLQVEVSTLCNKDLPLHVCVARVIDAASSGKHLLEKRAEKLRKAVKLIEKAWGG